MSPPFRAVLTILLLPLLLLSQAWTAECISQRQGGNRWVDIWASMPQLVESSNLPPSPFNHTGVVFENATLRQTIFITQPASHIRLVISNAFGGSDLPITAASVALPRNGTSGSSAIDPASRVPVTFSGGSATAVTVPNGARVVSDPIAFDIEAQGILAVDLYLAAGQATNSITGHPGSRTTSWYSPGNATGAEDLASLAGTQSSAHWYFLSAVEGYVPEGAGGAIALVGDSITDGRGSTTDGNDRWPDALLRRLQSSNSSDLLHNIAVINQAAGGNRVLADGLGPNALGRIDRDVLAHPGVRYALVFEGVNDIGSAAADAATQDAIGTALLAAYAQVVSLCRAHGIAVFGATITPFSGEGQEYSNPERERTRQRVNTWIRGEGKGRLDGVVDFDAAVRNPDNATVLDPRYDSGDHLHLNPAGYTAMAEAIDLGLFEKFKDGVEDEL